MEDVTIWAETLAKLTEAGRVLSAANRAVVEQIRDQAQKLAYHPQAQKIVEIAEELLRATETPSAAGEAVVEAVADVNGDVAADGSPSPDAVPDTLQEMIRQEGDKWILYSKDGERKLGEFATEEEAKEREREVEFFKNKKENTASDTTTVDVATTIVTEAHTERSWEDIERLVRQAINERFGKTVVYPNGMSERSHVHVMATYGDRVVFHHEGKCMEASYSVKPDGTVELGEPTPTVMTFERVSENAPHVQLVEAADKSGREWDVVLIEAGLSKNGNYYPADVLKKAVPLFEGAYAFADHTTDADRQARPERSIKDKVGRFHAVTFGRHTVGGRMVEGLKARFKVIAPWLREVLVEAVNAGEPDFLGFSIDAEGRVAKKQHNGRTVNWVEDIVKVHSVDVVTDPAAGGRVMRLVASNGQKSEEIKEAIVDPEELKKLIEEQVRAVVSDATREAVTAVIEAVKPQTEDLASQLEAMKETNRKREFETLVERRLGASTLSDLGKQIVRTRLTEGFDRRDLDDDEVDAMVKEQVAYEAAIAQANGATNPRSTSLRERVSMGDAPHDKYVKALQGWFLQTDVEGVPRFKTIRESYCRWNGIDWWDVNPVEMFYSFGSKYDSAVTHKKLKETLTTSSWGEIFADNLYVMMIRSYQEASNYDSWKMVVSDIEDVPDFQTRHWARVGGYADLATVSEQATYPNLTAPTDEEVTYTIAKRGGLDDVTLEMLTYDRGANKVRAVPTAMARSAKRTLWKFVLNMITTDNANVDYDSTALYVAGHSNTGTTALSLDGLRATIQAMRDQTAYNETSEILGERNVPKILIVPNELEFRAKRIINPSDTYHLSPTADTGTDVDPQAFKNMGMQVLVYDVLTDATDWWAVADPTKAPTMVMGFWNGQREPELFVQDEPTTGAVFTADKITYKVRHVYGGDILDHRSFYRQVVA